MYLCMYVCIMCVSARIASDEFSGCLREISDVCGDEVAWQNSLEI